MNVVKLADEIKGFIGIKNIISVQADNNTGRVRIVFGSEEEPMELKVGKLYMPASVDSVFPQAQAEEKEDVPMQ